MSLFSTATIDCIACGAPFPFEMAESVNADRDPSLRDAILAGRFQIATCPACGEAQRAAPSLVYLDLSLSLFVSAHPIEALAERSALARETAALFDENYGDGAGAAARRIGAELAPRVTFGWPALREKIAVRKAGLQDVTVELLKLDLLRRLPRAPLRRGVELRLLRAADSALSFAWLDVAAALTLERFDVDRHLLDQIAANPDGWARLRDALSKGPFVDAQALYLADDLI